MFRVCFLNICIEKNQNKWHFEEEKVYACISYYLALIPPCIYATVSIIKNCNIIFQKWGGGGAKAVWNFSKNSSNLVARPFPKFKIKVLELKWNSVLSLQWQCLSLAQHGPLKYLRECMISYWRSSKRDHGWNQVIYLRSTSTSW